MRSVLRHKTCRRIPRTGPCDAAAGRPAWVSCRAWVDARGRHGGPVPSAGVTRGAPGCSCSSRPVCSRAAAGDLDPVVATFVLLGTASLAWRRTAPLVALTVSGVALCATTAVGGPGSGALGPALVAVYSAVAWDRRLAGTVAAAVDIAAVAVARPAAHGGLVGGRRHALLGAPGGRARRRVRRRLATDHARGRRGTASSGPSARARRRPPARSPRSACASRASCTTCSVTTSR